MPTKSKDSVQISIRTLPEVSEAAKSCARIHDPEMGRTVSEVLNYMMLFGLKETYLKVYKHYDDINNEIIHWNHLRMIMIRDPSKKVITIEDIQSNSLTYDWWLSLFPKTATFSRSEVLVPFDYIHEEFEVHKQASDDLVKAMAVMNGRMSMNMQPKIMSDLSRVLGKITPDKIRVRPDLAVVD